MTWRMRSIVTLASLALPFQMRQCRTSATITARAFSRSGVSAGRVLAVLSACCRRMAMWNQSSNGGFVTPALSRIERSPEQPSVKAVNSVSAVLPVNRLPSLTPDRRAKLTPERVEGAGYLGLAAGGSADPGIVSDGGAEVRVGISGQARSRGRAADAVGGFS